VAPRPPFPATMPRMSTVHPPLPGRIPALLLTALAAALLSGCGGSPSPAGDVSASATSGATAMPSAARHRAGQGGAHAAKRSSTRAHGRAHRAKKRARTRAAARHRTHRATRRHAGRTRDRRRARRHRHPAAARFPTPRGTPAKLAYIARADRICGDFRRQRDALGAQPSTTSERAAYYDKLGGLIADASARLRRPPGPPALNHDVIVGYLAILDGNSADLHRLADATRAGDKGEQTRLADAIRKHSDRANALVRAYGMRVCGS
jgi:hypothetical protein